MAIFGPTAGETGMTVVDVKPVGPTVVFVAVSALGLLASVAVAVAIWRVFWVIGVVCSS